LGNFFKVGFNFNFGPRFFPTKGFNHPSKNLWITKRKVKALINSFLGFLKEGGKV